MLPQVFEVLREVLPRHQALRISSSVLRASSRKSLDWPVEAPPLPSGKAVDGWLRRWGPGAGK